MKMIILNDEELGQLEALNVENLNLHRAIKAIEIGENKHGVNEDILSDPITWENWIEFLETKPTEEVELNYDEELNLEDS